MVHPMMLHVSMVMVAHPSIAITPAAALVVAAVGVRVARSLILAVGIGIKLSAIAGVVDHFLGRDWRRGEGAKQKCRRSENFKCRHIRVPSERRRELAEACQSVKDRRGDV
jgi:hypothetical protein